MWSLYFEKFQYVQLWIGYGHRIRQQVHLLERSLLGTDTPPQLVGMSLLCGDNTLKSFHLGRYGWSIVINFREQVHLLGNRVFLYTKPLEYSKVYWLCVYYVVG